MAIISGVLQDALGNPINGSLTLRAKRTTANVIGDTYIKIGVIDGNYSLDLQPCEYDVVLTVDGYPKNHLNSITVYNDSPDGTLNDYLINPSGSDSMPEFLKQVFEARDAALKSAAEARESAATVDTSKLDELSNTNGSSLIGHHGSNLRAELDNDGRLNDLVAKMAAGVEVHIVGYGDSTTDGNTTSSWQRNVAGTNHNLNAPNAWPAQAQRILREMFNNNKIHVHNAGFSGQRIDNGWAANNYKTCVIDNKFYGVPDIVLIGFGINDSTYNKNDILGDTLRETNRLIDTIIEFGALPILLSCNVVRANGTESGRDKLQLLHQINGVKQYIAKTRNIQYLDLNTAVKQWVAQNTNGYNYTKLQPDLTHWGDLGHAFQACWIASVFYNRIVKINKNNPYEMAFFQDPRANSIVTNKDVSVSSNTRPGINIYVASKDRVDCRNKPILDIWVWCEHLDASIVYRRLLSDAGNATIKITDMLTGDNYTKTAGFKGKKFNDYSTCDAPFYVGQLQYGLNRVQLIGDSDQSSAFLCGYFDLVANYQGKPVCKNLLQKTGTFRDHQTVTAPATESAKSVSLTFSPDVYDVYGQNVVQLFNTDKTTNICLEGKFSAGTGIFLVQGNGRKKDEVAGLMLYGFSGSLSIYKHRYNTATGEVNFEQQGESATVKSDDDGVYRVTIKSYFNKNGSPVIDIYHNDKLAKSISWDGVDHIPPLAGVVGNIHRFQPANKSADMLVEISKFEVFYTDN